MSVSIKDIAKAAGVSHSTVSRALAGSSLVAEETRQRIRRLAKEMGYSPSAVARGLVTKRTHTVGLVVTTIADPFVAEVVRGIEEMALDNGYSVILCESNAEPQREITAVRILREKRVDGIIVTASRVGSLYLPLLEEVEVPIVLINNQREGRYVYSVATDNVHGGEMATTHLLELGHKRIGYITGPEGASSSLDRLAGYRRALRSQNIGFVPALVSSGNGRIEGGERAMHQLMTLCPPPTAVFCYNDMTAIGAIAEARRMGFRVPQDISVVGFDDIAFAAYVDPPLTTVEQRKYEMGQIAMKMVLDILAGVDTVSAITLQGQLVVRGSSGRQSS